MRHLNPRCTGNAGRVIADFYERYRQHHKAPDGIVPSLRDRQTGLGALEKKEAQEARILQEKADELAKSLWEHAGQPAGGYAMFAITALEQLKAATGRGLGRPTLTEGQRAELDRRIADDDANPDDGISWEQVRAKAKKPEPPAPY